MIDDYLTIIENLKKENEKLKERLRDFQNKHINALRWLCEITREKEKEYNEPENEENDCLKNSFGCECCCLHSS